MRRWGVVASAIGLVALLTPVAMAASSPPSSPFGLRGIIEGYYGTPFTHADRLDLVRWEAAHGMNIYINAAKMDPYVRAEWRQQYPPDQLAGLLEEVRLAAGLGVNWVPDVGPGVPEIPSPSVTVPDRDICFSCPSDLDVLVGRFQPFIEAGARVVMVSFDDTLKLSSHPEDAAAYGTGDVAIGTMDADLLDRLHGRLPGVRILTVPADYSGTSSTAYLAAFAARLDPSIVVMWTGTATVSASISASAAAAFDRIVHRRVVVWDNYPVNDYAGGAVGDPIDFYLGPVQGRGADLAGKIDGLVANPMAAWQADKIALATVADDLVDPSHYDPEASWRRAVAEVGGPFAEPLMEFAANSRSSPLDPNESVIFEPEAKSFWRAYAGSGWLGPAHLLAAELDAELAAPGQLRSGFNAEFVFEAGPFLDRLGLNATTGRAALELMADERPSVAATIRTAGGGTEVVDGMASPPDALAAAATRVQLAARDVRMLADVHNVHGDRFSEALDAGLTVNHNLMDAFVERALQSDASWLPMAALAISKVTVTVNGRGVPTHFSVVLPAGTTARIVVTDGSGARTDLVVTPPA
jgi:hyaluronoglucosaminidase